MSCNCNNGQTCYQCAPTLYLSNCEGCAYTLNSDCIVFNGDRLSFEDLTVKDGSARTLTALLDSLEALNCCEKESKIVEEDYTLEADDSHKLILLKGIMDDVSGGELAYQIVLPIDIAFANKTFTFKDISGLGTGGRTIGWYFDINVQYRWTAVTSTQSYTTLQDSTTHRMLRLTFVKIDSVNYAWIPVT